MVLTSNVFRGETDTLENKVIRAAKSAALIGWNEMVDQYLSLIARKTGALRTAFRSVGLDIINRQLGARRINFSVQEIYSRLVNKLSYAEHHLEVGPTGDEFYFKPTTDGTQPIKSAIFIPILNREAQAAFLRQLQVEGIQVRRRR